MSSSLLQAGGVCVDGGHIRNDVRHRGLHTMEHAVAEEATTEPCFRIDHSLQEEGHRELEEHRVDGTVRVDCTQNIGLQVVHGAKVAYVPMVGTVLCTAFIRAPTPFRQMIRPKARFFEKETDRGIEELGETEPVESFQCMACLWKRRCGVVLAADRMRSSTAGGERPRLIVSWVEATKRLARVVGIKC